VFNGFDLNLIGVIGGESNPVSIGTIAIGNVVDDQIDINLNGSIFYSGEHATLCSIYFGENVEYNIVNLSNLDATNFIPILVKDDNGFDGLIDINLLTLSDSDISGAYGALAYVDQNTNINTFYAYNNIFRNVDLDVNFIGEYNNNIDQIILNSDLNQYKNQRLKIFDDDSNYIGGNLWLDSEGDNLCSSDSINPRGICDSEISVIVYDANLETYETVDDNYPLIEYVIDDGGNGGNGGGGSGSNTDSNDYFDLQLNVNNTNELSSNVDLNLTINVVKTGKKSANDFSYSIYAYYSDNKQKIIESVDYGNSNLPINQIETINWNDLPGTKEKYLDNNKIKFLVELNVSGDNDLQNNFKEFSVSSYIGNIDVNTIKTDNSNKDENIFLDKNVLEYNNLDQIYLIVYKDKLGLNEEQIIFVFDDKNNLLRNVGITVLFGENNYFILTDNFGKAIFVPKELGEYEIIVPYDEKLVSGKFVVIKDYISSKNDFVEVISKRQGFNKLSSNAKIAIVVSSIAIVIIILSILLYFVFKPKKKFYDFEDTDFYKQSEYHISQTELKKEIIEVEREKNILKSKYKLDL
jgi:hypothetical protein